MHYVGVRDDRICLVSDKPFQKPGVDVFPLDSEASADDILCSYRVRQGRLVHRWGPQDPTRMRLAVIGNWRMACGISTYAEHLWSEVGRHVADIHLFVEETKERTGDPYRLGGRFLEEGQVEWCWQRGKPLTRLIESIRAYDPDVVWVQHEWGLFPDARHWLSFMSRMQRYRTIVTMHSVFPRHLDKVICEAATPEIIVHQDGAEKALRQKGVSSRIHVIPHGCYPATNRRLWNLYRSDQTVLQFGFGFRYKGWETSVRAIDIVRRTHPNVFFTGLFSESAFSKVEHERYYNELTGLVDSLGLQENVALIRGYKSDAAIDAYLQTNSVAVFPYISEGEHEVFGASGAARMAMSRGVPVVTSRANHFSDVPSRKADSPEELAAEILHLFSYRDAAQTQLARQAAWIEDNSWERVAERHLEVFRSAR